MKIKLTPVVISVIIIATAFAITGQGQSANTLFNYQRQFTQASAIAFRPNRILIVIDDWTSDPSSYVDGSQWAFHDVACLLKLWSMPFDILQLDGNELNIDQFLDLEGNAKYGVIIWNCRPDTFTGQDWSVLETVVTTYGISIIALADTVSEPHIQSLLRIGYVDPDWYQITDSFVITANHFITRGYVGTVIPAGGPEQEGTMGGYGCHITFDTAITTVLGFQGTWPQLAVRDITETTKAVWIGGNRDEEFHLSPVMANILRRAITYCVGYSIYKTYPNTVMLRIDDMGTAQDAYLNSWYYPQLTKEQIETSLIQPLEKYGAVLGVMYVPGYVMYSDRTIVKSWTVDWVDPFGTEQNLVSNYLGILEGLDSNVFEVESHGWTHMQPDLSSAPGPWWTNSAEWANPDWYREFYDTRRDKDIDAVTQQYHLDQSVQWIQQAFNAYPLVFAAPGHSISGYPSINNVPATYTYKIAAAAGFGLASDANGYCYLGSDLVLPDMKVTRTYYVSQTSDVQARINTDWNVPVTLTFHDLDVVSDSEFLGSCLSQIGTVNYVTPEEFVGYLHAQPGNMASGFTLTYDDHYCKYFANHSSEWVLEFSDMLLAELNAYGNVDIIVDGTTVNASTYFSEIQTLDIPAGSGTHTIQFTQSNGSPHKNTFSISSDSTISAFTFNSTSLAFVMSDPAGTTQATLEKTLVDITNLKVYVNGEPTDYSVDSTDESWIISFTP